MIMNVLLENSIDNQEDTITLQKEYNFNYDAERREKLKDYVLK